MDVAERKALVDRVKREIRRLAAAHILTREEASQQCIDTELAAIWGALAKLEAGSASEAASEEQGLDAAATRLLAPLVARLGGTVSLSAEDLAKPWSLSVLELPDGGVTLVAVELKESDGG